MSLRMRTSDDDPDIVFGTSTRARSRMPRGGCEFAVTCDADGCVQYAHRPLTDDELRRITNREYRMTYAREMFRHEGWIMGSEMDFCPGHAKDAKAIVCSTDGCGQRTSKTPTEHAGWVLLRSGLWWCPDCVASIRAFTGGP